MVYPDNVTRSKVLTQQRSANQSAADKLYAPLADLTSVMKRAVAYYKQNQGGAATVASTPLACQNIKYCAIFSFTMINPNIFLRIIFNIGRGPSQYVIYDLIICYVSKTIYLLQEQEQSSIKSSDLFIDTIALIIRTFKYYKCEITLRKSQTRLLKYPPTILSCYLFKLFILNCKLKIITVPQIDFRIT